MLAHGDIFSVGRNKQKSLELMSSGSVVFNGRGTCGNVVTAWVGEVAPFLASADGRPGHYHASCRAQDSQSPQQGLTQPICRKC